LGILDERLRRGPAGWRQRLALIEASDLSWLTQDRIGLDRLSLYMALRVSTVTDDAQALYRIGWTVRRLTGGPAPLTRPSCVGDLETFLDRRARPGQGERFEEAKAPSRMVEMAEREAFEDRAAGWLAMMDQADDLHPVTRACMGFHLWHVAELSPVDDPLEAAVTASRVAITELAPSGILGGIGLVLLSLLGFMTGIVLIFAKMMLTLMLGLAPIMIALSLFDATKDFFHRWVSTTISYAFYPIVIAAMFSTVVGMANSLLAQLGDPNSAIRRQLQDQFLYLSRSMGKTTIFITHDLDEAIRIGSRIAIMKDGEIIQIGTPAEIVARPADAYVAAFVANTSRLNVVPAHSIMEDPQAYRARRPDAVDLSLLPVARPEMALSELLRLAAAADTPLAIHDSGQIIGVIDQARLLRGIQGDAA
jgi:hypothetical protein